MIVRMHKTGRSFKGIAKYLLHDPDHAKTDDRVAWTATRNLATRNSEVASRVMAATALDQDRLKKEAGVKSTGRKSNKHVMHYSLSWHEEEAGSLTRDEMLQAVEQSLAVLGRDATDKHRRQYANEHQAMIVCHDDEPHPHVHVVVNRVHPEHGVMLPSSYERDNLSRWAKQYEQERGKIYCENREHNENARQNGGKRKGNKNKSRDVYELEKQHGKDSSIVRIYREQRAKDRQLVRRTQSIKQRHQENWSQWRDSFRREKEAVSQQVHRQASRDLAALKKDFEPRWRKLLNKQRQDLVAFGKREGHFLGRIQNALAGIQLQNILSQRDRVGALRYALAGIGSRDGRLEALKKAHLHEARKLQAKERKTARNVVYRARVRRANQMSDRRVEWLEKREHLLAKHQQEKAQLKEAWRVRKEERQKAVKQHVVERDFNAAARNADPRRDRGDSRSPRHSRKERLPRRNDLDQGRTM